MIEHISRLKALQELELPDGIEHQIHQNRLLKLARKGAQMIPGNIAKFEPARRHATLVATVIDAMATLKDEFVDLHDRIMAKMFNTAKNKHAQQFHQAAKSINEKVRHFGQIVQALLDAKAADADPFVAIEGVMPWESFAQSVAEAQQLARPAEFDHLHHVSDN